MTDKINETMSAAAANAIGGGGIETYSPLLSKKRTPQEILQDRVKSMDKEGKRGKNPNPLNNTFNNGNSEMKKKHSLDAIRQSFDREKKKTKPLRSIVGK